jgi:hypothetical protein
MGAVTPISYRHVRTLIGVQGGELDVRVPQPISARCAGRHQPKGIIRHQSPECALIQKQWQIGSDGSRKLTSYRDSNSKQSFMTIQNGTRCFTQEDLAICTKRLKEYGYLV